MRLFSRNRRSQGAENASSSPSASYSTSSSPQEFAAQAESLIPAEVRMISGCHSEQTSADVSNVTSSIEGKLPSPAGRAGGACTSALLGLLYQKPKTTFQELLLDLRNSLSRSGFDQIPQLTSSRNLEIQDTPFSLVGPGGGTRRAVLVGINYRGQSGQLSGCHNDVLNMKKYLVEEQGYLEHNILVLIDDGRHHFPTREKVIRALQQLVAQSVPGDSCYFHYSGHGGLLSPNWNAFKNRNKEYDETLYPLDHAHAGQIRDFSLFNHFVKPMAAGVTVTCVMDCCHSGSVLDLPFTYQPTSGGTIRMRQSMDTLSNLAFLHILAGGILPHGFGHIAQHIESVTGGNIDSFQGTGLDEVLNDTEASDFSPDEYYGDSVGDGGFSIGDGDVDPALDGADAYPEFGGRGGVEPCFEDTDVGPEFDGLDVNDSGFDGPGIGRNMVGPDMVPDMGDPDPYFADRGGAYEDSTAAFDQSGFVVPTDDVDVDSSGFMAGMFDGGGDDGDGGGGFSMGDAAAGFDGMGADAPNIDCGCLQDILGALLEED